MNAKNGSVGPIQIDIMEDYGAAQGYIVAADREQLPNWLEKHQIYDAALVTWLRSEFQAIAFLNNINVTEDARGKGHGLYLLDAFREQVAYDASAILLLADTGETNDFDLVKWYERLGFEMLRVTAGGPLMVMRI